MLGKKKRFSKLNGKSPGAGSVAGAGGGTTSGKSESGGSAHGNQRGWVSMASTSTVGGISSDGLTPTAESVHSDASHRPGGRGANRFGSHAGSALRPAKPPPAPMLGGTQRRGTYPAVVEPGWGTPVDSAMTGGVYEVTGVEMGASPSRMVGTRSGRRNKKKNKESCDVS